MRGRGNLLLGCVAGALCLAALLSSAALADDANSVPPHLELSASGTPENPVGRLSGSLAYYKTDEPDSSWGYSEGSRVTFTCLIDGLVAPCSQTYHRPCCPTLVPKRWICRRPVRRTASAPQRKRRCRPPRPNPIAMPVPDGKVLGYGPYSGWVPIPPNLPSGEHKVTVIAADEDGVDPNPPTVTAVFDIVPPSAPVLLSAPARVSRDSTPIFRFTATDDRRLYLYNDPFSATLQRIKPRGRAIGNGTPIGDYLERRGPFCSDLLTCTETVWSVYSGNGEGGTTFGIRERLRPALYELRVTASDAVDNESPVTKYRFRVLASNSR